MDLFIHTNVFYVLFLEYDWIKKESKYRIPSISTPAYY